MYGRRKTDLPIVDAEFQVLEENQEQIHEFLKPYVGEETNEAVIVVDQATEFFRVFMMGSAGVALLLLLFAIELS